MEAVMGTQEAGRRAGASGTPSAGTLAGHGEFALIDAVVARLGAAGWPADVVLGPGDDAAVLAAPDGHAVVTIDVLVEGVHFRTDWSGGADVGRKAAAASLSDVAAMGARTTGLVVGLVAPPELEVQWALDLADGLRDEAARAGATVVGGDLTRGRSLVMAVTALGDLGGRAAIRRSGARAGDVVAVCGRLGWAAAGLAVLGRGFRSPRALVEAYRHPAPDYSAGPRAARAGATALVDVSDGLLADLGHVARASGVVVDLDPAAFAGDTADGPLADAAAAMNTDPLAWVLGGGEDHALAGCFPPGVSLPDGFRAIGRVGAGDPQVLWGGVPWAGSAGWDHFC
jgi:thiamine-monophosphate kinase